MVTIPGIGAVSFGAGRVDPDRDQLQVRPRERGRAVRGRRVSEIEAWRTDPDSLFASGGGGAGVTRLTRAALEADLAEHVFARAAERRRSRRAGSARRWSSFRSRRPPDGDVRIEGDGSAGHRSRSSGGTARGRAGARPATAKGTPCFELPAGGTLTFEPGGQLEYSSPPAGRPARCSRCFGRSSCRSAPPRPTRESISSRSASIRSTRWSARRCCFTHQALRAGWRSISARIGPAGREDDAADRGVPGEPRFRRRAVAPLAVLNAAAPYVDGDLRQLTDLRRRGHRLPEHPGPGVARARSGANRAAVGRAEPGRAPTSISRSRPGDPAAAAPRRAPALRRVAGHARADAGGVARPPEHALPRGPPARPPRAALVRRGARRSGTPPRSRWRSGSPTTRAALRAAADLLGRPDLGLLDRAGRVGPGRSGDSRGRRRIWSRSRSPAAQALGPAYFHPADLEQARCFFDQYTRRGRSPADDVVGTEIAA